MKAIPSLAKSVLVLTSLTLAQTDKPMLKRTPVATIAVSPGKEVDHVQVTRLDFMPGQRTPRHTHPMPVVGYVESGAFVVQIEGQPSRRYVSGQAIYEPANNTIERFDNESSTEPAVLIANYLAGRNDADLIKLLPSAGPGQ